MRQSGGSVTCKRTPRTRQKPGRSAWRNGMADALQAVGRLDHLTDYIEGYASRSRRRERTPQALHTVLSEFERGFGPLVGRLSVKLNWAVSPRHLRTRTMTRTELEAILINLLTNALKACTADEGGIRHISVVAQQEGDEIALRFQDTGVGVPRELRKTLFEPFVTSTRPSESYLGAGTGLGLKVVRDVAEANGGSASLGEPSDGFFDVRRNTAAYVAEGTRAMTSTAGVNAILIDDNPEDRDRFRRLERHGMPCTAIAPPSLEEVQDAVVASVNDGTYNLVLVDFLLDQEAPKHGKSASYRGSTPAALVKERCPDVPVVLVTTEERYRDYVEHRSDLGALFDFVLSKKEVRTKEDRVIAAQRLRDLALGFQKLRVAIESEDSKTRWERLRTALEATDEEFHSLRNEWPSEFPGSASELGRWLLNGLLRYPGAATRRPRNSCDYWCDTRGNARRNHTKHGQKQHPIQGCLAEFTNAGGMLGFSPHLTILLVIPLNSHPACGLLC